MNYFKITYVPICKTQLQYYIIKYNMHHKFITNNPSYDQPSNLNQLYLQ